MAWFAYLREQKDGSGHVRWVGGRFLFGEHATGIL